MSSIGIGVIVDSVSRILDDVFTSDEERLKIELESQKEKRKSISEQISINKIEASHSSLFIAGWRPAIGWVGAVSLAYQFLLYPILVWGWHTLQAMGHIALTLQPPPTLPVDLLWVILSGMLGIAGMRSFDKTKVNTNK